MVSVCMATYNGEKYIKAQIDSILSQLEENDELVISDDGSTDKTLEIIKDCNDKRIKVYQHTKPDYLAKIKFNRSYYYAASNFGNALLHANGDYIFFTDQDDIWAPQKKDKMISYLKDNNADCVQCNFSIIDSNNNIVLEKGFIENPIKKTLLTKVIKSRFIGSSMCFTRDLLNASVPFPKKLRAHDLWVGCHAKKILFLDESLTLYRRHDENVSTGIGKSTNKLWYKIFYRIVFLFQYFSFKSSSYQAAHSKEASSIS